MNYYLGIDCGGTFIKAALFDENGNIQACERENVTVVSKQSGYAERDMDELWQMCTKVIRRTLKSSKIRPHLIKSVGISAQGKGAFLLDKHNRPLGRAILSSDQRAQAIVKRWQAEGLEEKVYPLSRQGLWTGHPVAILRWLKENEPARYRHIGNLLMSHDYLRFCLTGNLYCEESNISESNLYNMITGKYDPRLAQLLGIEEITEKLPPVIKANQIAGYVTEQAAQACGLAVGTPVVGGVFDVTAMTLCLTDNQPGKLNVVLGTWSIVTGISDSLDDRLDSRFAHGRYVEAGKFLIQEASPTSAGNLEWFVKQWNLDYQQINQMIAPLPPAQSTVVFLPFLYGTNAKLGMTAGFYGMQAHHTQAHLLQAVYEGVLFSLMTHLERMYRRFPQIQTLRVTGGPAKSAVWLQMLADLTGKILEVPEVEEIGCLGAALMAAEGVGANGSALKRHQAIRVIRPNPANFDAYRNKYRQYQKLVELLAQMT
ncbi:carbohydrate kinase [Actinobacillus succinogenes]|uniref:Carbohydrate kinase FGGY n=1 Tax=Actinobacillus succinogenes (strain ATCC 55618 / DSM 22257 / CCUG 43843 / 130Z) TaxID=339671 RepID=A6VKG8_ACTSZ|nr:FGGY-family carbohydrate kinase [Actinobacillus succinogenes]ABR73465.1 carbohydrate kinase FGGY [Actinobacillus succinogenes 130Z]PHI40073.1 carbohydrate kinase [Actinobacillus succinogenes]